MLGEGACAACCAQTRRPHSTLPHAQPFAQMEALDMLDLADLQADLVDLKQRLTARQPTQMPFKLYSKYYALAQTVDQHQAQESIKARLGEDHSICN